MKVQSAFMTWLLVTVLGSAAIVVVRADAAPPWGRGYHGCPCAGFMAGGRYDPGTVEKLSGEVTSLDGFAGPRGRGGIHVVMKVDKEVIAVHLGPAWYLDQQGLTVARGDQITVRGSRIDVGGKPEIIAAEITKTGHTIVLRDRDGIPVWASGCPYAH